MSKWNLVRESMERAHEDLFETDRYSCEFYNYDGGDYNPDTGQIENDTRSSIGTVDVEIVPPSQDSSINNQGSSFDWSTSIRFPEDENIVGQITPLGETDRPTEVELTDQQNNTTEVFELHSYTTEIGSGMIMCRLTEQ